MPIKTAQAEWQGDFRSGQGTIAGGSGAFEADYSRSSIFGAAPGTSPLEVLGASLAGCFAGAVAAYLTTDGYVPESISANAEVHIEPPDSGYTVSKIHLSVQAQVPGIDPACFLEYAERAERTCPVAQALGGVEITLDAKLI